ncbi:MAG: hypothetical protein GOVbin1454_1 [Prokaryotic dsDNA virus sp.]|nr:MAG: hypothetical protein GOVbin1454_1 [Prokaryotic dsDNA virus sp.]|tara:strand:- start:9587 stop:11575 length:1989 start_codon:yes stop_codon:yes gene_type:complete
MARWSRKFKQALEADVYAPQFRLVIGTPAITNRLGAWEAGVKKVLEIASHPGTASYAGVTGNYGEGTVNGAPYRFLVGLTDKINLGAQSVSPRKFQYTGAQLTVQVSRAAAEFAMQLATGTLSRLQCRLKGQNFEDTDFETIHYGVYRGCKWNGETYTLSFGDALEAAEQRIYYNEDWAGGDSTDETPSQAYSWFAGCGGTTKTSAALTALTGTSPLDTVTTYSAEHVFRWGHAYKKPDAFGGQDYSYGPPIFPAAGATRIHNIWNEVTNHAGKRTYISYSAIIRDPGDGSMKFANVESDGVFPHRGRKRATHSDVGGLDVNSVVKQTCIIHGTPVTELVNTIYTLGYHEEMVCGLFGETVDDARDCLNVVDINTQHHLFNRIYQRLAGFLPTAVIPVFASITSTSQSGYSDMKKLMAKWGVFPRFKEGGYSVGLTSQFIDRTEAVGRERLILEEDIESAEIDFNDPKCKGAYNTLRLVSSDDGERETEVTFTTSTPTGAFPIVPELQLNNSDVAAGGGTAGGGIEFFKYFSNNIFIPWFVNKRTSVSLRLKGLRFAGLSVGDHVDIMIRGSDGAGMGFAWGPSFAATVNRRHFLNTIDNLDQKRTGEYFVTSVKVDWIGAKVHVTLNRQQSHSIQKSFKNKPQGRLTNATGMPQADLDGDL